MEFDINTTRFSSGKYFVEIDTNVTKEKVETIYFARREDLDKRLNKLVKQYGVEVINAIGEYND